MGQQSIFLSTDGDLSRLSHLCRLLGGGEVIKNMGHSHQLPVYKDHLLDMSRINDQDSLKNTRYAQTVILHLEPHHVSFSQRFEKTVGRKHWIFFLVGDETTAITHKEVNNLTPIATSRCLSNGIEREWGHVNKVRAILNSSCHTQSISGFIPIHGLQCSYYGGDREPVENDLHLLHSWRVSTCQEPGSLKLFPKWKITWVLPTSSHRGVTKPAETQLQPLVSSAPPLVEITSVMCP